MEPKRWLIAGCAVAFLGCAAVVAIVTFLLSQAIFFRLLAVGGVLMTGLSLAAMIVATRRATVLKVRALAVSIVVSVLSVVVFAWLLGVRVGPLAWVASPFVGGVLGALWSFTTRLRLENGRVQRQGNVLTLVAWALLFVLQQALAAGLGRAPSTGMVLLLLGTGIVVGQSAMLMVRALYLRSATA